MRQSFHVMPAYEADIERLNQARSALVERISEHSAKHTDLTN
jgi:hypothetical protein